MSGEVIVYKDRDNVVRVHLGTDVSADTFTSEIRTEPSQLATLIATWGISFETDGTDGKLLLELDAITTGGISAKVGFMDIKKVSGALELPVFDRPLEVVFREAVTA